MDYLRCLSVSQEYINLILFFVKSKKKHYPKCPRYNREPLIIPRTRAVEWGQKTHRCQDGDDFDTGVT